MKKRMALILAAATMSCCIYAPALAVQISPQLKESAYFSSYYYDLEPSGKNGYFDFESLVVTTNNTDSVRVTVQIQQYDNGWEDYGKAYAGTSTKAAYALEDTVKVDRGEEYRAKFHYEAIVNGKVVETKIFATSGIDAP